jgi:hypothetical protein
VWGANPAEEAAGAALFNEGRALLSAGKVEQACSKFLEARRLFRSVGILLNLGDCSEKLGKVATAWGAFTEAELLARNSGDTTRQAEAERRAKLLEGRLPKVTIAPAKPLPGLEVRWDGRIVGQGQWDSAIPVDPGEHTIEASAPGKATWTTKVNVDAKPVVSTVTIPALEPAPEKSDGSSAAPRKPFAVAVQGSPVLLPSFGGDVAKSCSGTCTAPMGVGAVVLLDASYEFDSGVVVGLTGGYLSVAQSLTSRPSTLKPVGISANKGAVDDSLLLRAGLVGASGGWHLHTSGRLSALFRLGAGAALGAMRDERTGRFTASDGTRYSVGPLADNEAARFFYISPEARLGVTFAERFEVTAGFQALVLVALTQPKWNAAASVVGQDGIAKWTAETLTGKALIVLAPSVALRASF